jgi:subtilisin family serine protease
VADYPTIGQGATGADVVTLQQALALFGSYQGVPDGVYGADTASAVQAFQASQGLGEDGVAGTDTWAQLVMLGLVPPADPVAPGLVIAQFDRSVGVQPGTGAQGAAQVTSSSGADLSAVNDLLAQAGIQSIATALAAPAGAQAFFDDLAQQQGVEIPSFGDFLLLRFDPSADVQSIANQLAGLSGVVLATPSFSPKLCAVPSDPLVGTTDQVSAGQKPPNQWYLFRCHADEAWGMSTGSGVIIGVIDSGFTLDHEDLAANFDLTNAWDAASSSSTIPQPPSIDHGTHVSGFAAAAANNGKGMAGFAYDSSIVPVQWSATGAGFASGLIAAGILHITFIPGPARKVINLSLGLGFKLPDGTTGDLIAELDPTIAYMIRLAGLANIPVCLAAGNSDRDAGFDLAGNAIQDAGSIVVGATVYDPTTNPHRIGTAWGQRVDVCAPGDSSNDTTCMDPRAASLLSPYGTAGFTSNATPKAAGTVALMLAANPALTTTEVRDIVRQTGTATTPQPGKPVGAFLHTGAAVHEALHRRLVSQFGQDNWRWCNKCQGLFFGGNPGSVCPAGATHDPSGSSNYVLVMNSPIAFSQAGWCWCNKCQGLFFGGNPGSVCPVGGGHDSTGSGAFQLSIDGPVAFGQDNWRWCNKCQGLFFGGNPGSVCPAGGGHDSTGSGDYVLKQR